MGKKLVSEGKSHRKPNRGILFGIPLLLFIHEGFKPTVQIRYC
jgi:hypothetical protein